MRGCRTVSLAITCTCVALASSGCGPGTAVALRGLLQVSPSAVNFGDVNVGQMVKSTIALSNSGLAAIAVSQVSVAGKVFQLVAADQLPISIFPGDTRIVQVGFAPASENVYSGELTVLDAAAAPIAQIPMSGHGRRHGQIVVSSTTLDFGNVVEGSSATRTLMLTWTGAEPITINSGSIKGPGFSAPALQFPLTLNPQSPLAVQVQFAPTTTGSAAGQLVIGSPSMANSTTVRPERDRNYTALGAGVEPAIGCEHSEARFWRRDTQQLRDAGGDIDVYGNGASDCQFCKNQRLRLQDRGWHGAHHSEPDAVDERASRFHRGSDAGLFRSAYGQQRFEWERDCDRRPVRQWCGGT